MRINRYVAQASGLSRRTADKLIAIGKVKIDGLVATTGQEVADNQRVTLDDKLLVQPALKTIILNKPAGYIVSRKGQGGQTIYSLLPTKYSQLKPVGRLDKDSSGLLILSNDGMLSQRLAHPSFNKQKVYEVVINKALTTNDKQAISNGVNLEDGVSRLKILSHQGRQLVLSMEEGRNRQIRRTFDALGYAVTRLNRISFGDYTLDGLKSGEYQEVST